MSGFDSRPNHNYYVHAINVFHDTDDVGYKPYKEQSDLYDPSLFNEKIHDGRITGLLYFEGDFAASYQYCYNTIAEAAKIEGIRNYQYLSHENGKAISYFHLYNYKYTYSSYYGKNINQFVDLKGYNLLYKNCVQESLRALIVSDKAKSDCNLKKALSKQLTQPIPNVVFAELSIYTKTSKIVELTLKQANAYLKELREVIKW